MTKKVKEEKEEIEKGEEQTRKKRGRSSRRRRAKARSINRAVEALLAGGSSESIERIEEEGEWNEDGLSLPKDRDKSLPGVLIRRKEANIIENSNSFDSDDDFWNQEDKEMLTSQLGFVPGNGISVVARVQHLTSTTANTTDRHAMGCGNHDNDNGDDELKRTYPYLSRLLLRQNKVQNGNVHDLKKYPTVLKLYPLAVRQVYNGGKSDGRKFKSRKRGQVQTHDATVITDPDPHTTNHPIKNQCETQMQQSPQDETNINNPTQHQHCDQLSTIEPFPTMYWLTHPHLRTLISQLEISSDANVRIMEQRLEQSPPYESKFLSQYTSTNPKHTMENAHKSYGNQRWNLLTQYDKDNVIRQNHWEGAVGSERGVAGIRRYHTVKCLHAHAAHYLAFHAASRPKLASKGVVADTDVDAGSNAGAGTNSHADVDEENIIGKWVMEAVEERVKSKHINA